MNAPDRAHSRGDALLWAGLVLILAPLLTRAVSVSSPFPAWETDPLSSGGFDSGLTPTGSLIVDTLIVLGAALLMLHARARGVIASRSCLLLAAIGAVPVIMHALILGEPRGSIGHARIGFAWLSAIFAGVAVFHGAHDPRVRRVITALLAGLMVLFAMRGCVEYFIEFPRQVAAFREDKVRILASHGWTEGSSMALGFERRLMQPEASGWFGLSNVYASIAAAGVTLGLGLLLSALQRGKLAQINSKVWITASLVTLSSAACLYFAQSKGGVIACAAGLLALASLAGVRALLARGLLDAARARRIAGLIGLGAVIGALALIALRAVIGERISELSMLFRGYYAEAALRIFAKHPIWGVGPDGFQDAYALNKNPLSPEEPTSPHIIVLDYLSTLGVLGLAWVGLVMRGACAAGVAAVSPDAARSAQLQPDEHSRAEFRAVVFIPALVTLVATYLQGILVTPEISLVRVLGLIAWSAVSWGIAKAMRDGLSATLALSAGTLALLAHAQIDLAGSWTHSCAILSVWCAVAAAPMCSASIASPPRRSRPLLAGAACALALAACVAITGVRTFRWEHHLLAARDALAPMISLVNRIALNREQSAPGVRPKESMSVIAADLARLVGLSPAPDDREFSRQMRLLEVALVPRAVAELREADAVDRSDFRARREASRLLTRRGEHLLALGQPAPARASFEEAARLLAQGPAPSPGEYFAKFLVQDRMGTALADAQARQDAAATLDLAIAGDPHNLDFVLRRFKIAQLANDTKTGDLARRCLDLDALMIHDKAVRGLSAADRAEVERAAGLTPTSSP